VFAVIAGEVATPELLVVAVAVLEPLKVALAPELGAVNVTVTPDTGLLLASLTVTTSGAGKAIPT
jgi:hypothetical protein